MPKPWERQPDESDVAFEAFCVYRDMGTERSLRSVAEKLNKSSQLMGRWSGKFSWVDRVSAWEDEQDRILCQEQIKDIKKMRQRHADLAMEMLAKALEGIQYLHPEELNAVSISRLVEVASKLEQKSRGDTTDAVEMREAEEKQPSPVMFYMPSNGRNPELEANTAEKPTEE
ncbi:MAG: hypothetical protein IIV02_07305 [Peptococcaceae bacterium]|nr:hypothetical protein [Peptococcaceae bacterium]